MDPQNLPAPPIARNPLGTANPGEQLVCEIKRHPIGILALYMGIGLLLVVVALLVFFVAPRVLPQADRQHVMEIGTLVFAGIGVIAAIILLVAHKVYWGNRWIVTSDNITQVKQISLFYKQTSQLSLANLEDITAEQNGILPQMLHYGVISAETAAATDKFTFIYCPNPTYYTQQILAARERFEERRRQSQGGQSDQPATTLPPSGNSLADSLTNASQNISPEQ